jgi:hypothetical protein
LKLVVDRLDHVEDILGGMGYAVVGPSHELELEYSPSLAFVLNLKLLDTILVIRFLAVDERDLVAIAVDTGL